MHAALPSSGDYSAGEDSYDQQFTSDGKQAAQQPAYMLDSSDVYSQDASVHDSFEDSYDYVEPVEPI